MAAVGRGELTLLNRSRKSPRAHPGGLRTASAAATVDKKARTRRRTLPREKWGGAPHAMFLLESTDPRHGELEDAGMRESGRGRGVIVTSARQGP